MEGGGEVKIQADFVQRILQYPLVRFCSIGTNVMFHNEQYFYDLLRLSEKLHEGYLPEIEMELE